MVTSASASDTVDVAQFGAVVDDGRDDSAAINRAIAHSPIGATVRFASGTYRIGAKIELLPYRNYVGRKTVLLARMRKGTRPILYAKSANAIAISGLVFRGGGLSLGAGRNVVIKSNRFAEIYDPRAEFGNENGIIISGPLSDVLIDGNKFHDIGVRGEAKGSDASNAIIAFDLRSARITDNAFQRVHQAISLNFGQATRAIRVTGNTIVDPVRMGIELHAERQDASIQVSDVVVAKNRVVFKRVGNEDIGISVVLHHSPGAHVFANRLEAPAHGICRGMGIEAGGVATRVEANDIRGNWCSAIGIYADDVQHARVVGNRICGHRSKYDAISFYNGRFGASAARNTILPLCASR